MSHLIETDEIFFRKFEEEVERARILGKSVKGLLPVGGDSSMKKTSSLPSLVPNKNVLERHSPQPKPLDRISKRSENWKLGKVTAEKRRVKKIFNLDMSHIADKGPRAETK